MYIETQEPAICQNKNCEDYKSWEMYEFKDVQNDLKGYYYVCRSCKEKIYV